MTKRNFNRDYKVLLPIKSGYVVFSRILNPSIKRIGNSSRRYSTSVYVQSITDFNYCHFFLQCWDQNAEHKSCGTACVSQCGKEFPEMCIAVCVSGCFCKSGYIKDYRGICISDEECATFKSSECHKQVAEIQPEDVDEFIPTCDPNGQFSVTQCHGSTGNCWCAHRNGTKIDNTEVRGDPGCIRGMILIPKTLHE